MSNIPLLPPSFFERDPLTCAKELIGCEMVNGSCGGIIIETEAYHETGDEACHTFMRPSARAFVDSHPAGTAYVYLNYGVHWLANIVCHDVKNGGSGFVLFRALEPSLGITRMKKRRSLEKERDLCSGPGKLTKALGVDGSYHGSSLTKLPGLHLRRGASHPEDALLFDKRVGISKSRELLWRVLARDHPGVSVPFGKVR